MRPKGVRGWRPFWPELTVRHPYCYTCGCHTTPAHATSQRHRQSTRAPEYYRGAGSWLSERHVDISDASLDRYYDDLEARVGVPA